MSCWFVLPSVTVGVGEAKEEDIGWQPISAISLQQSFHLWQCWSQKHSLFEQLFKRDHIQHPELLSLSARHEPKINIWTIWFD